MSQQNQTEQRVLQFATRLWRAMEYSLSKLPEPTQSTLKLRIDEGTVQWALALVLAGWRLSDPKEAGATDLASVMQETGASLLVQQISSLQMLLPDSFGQFVTSAREADTDPKLAGAGAYLASAVTDLGETRRSSLDTWLRGLQFREVGKALLRRFPMPSSNSSPIGGAPDAKPAQMLTPPRPPSRSDRFDRADFSPRKSRANAPAAPRAQRMASTGTPPRPPPPRLDGSDVARAYLFTLGWEGHEVDRLLMGPSGAPQRAPKRSA